MHIVSRNPSECLLEQLLAERLHLSGERIVEIDLADELCQASIQRAALDDTLTNSLPVLLARSQADHGPGSSCEDLLHVTMCQFTPSERVKAIDQHVAVGVIGRQRRRLASEVSQHLGGTQATCIVESIRPHWACR